MVEVFKTNVENRAFANELLYQIHKVFAEHKANFDLDDCDRILRVASTRGLVNTSLLIDLLKEFGCDAEVLPDDDQAMYQPVLTREFSIR